MSKTNPYIKNEVSIKNDETSFVSNSLLDTFDTKNFLIGLAVGAVGTYILTNENAQKAIFKTVAGGTEMFQAGIEEMKERFEDAKAELEASKE